MLGPTACEPWLPLPSRASPEIEKRDWLRLGCQGCSEAWIPPGVDRQRNYAPLYLLALAVIVLRTRGWERWGEVRMKYIVM